MLVICQIQSQGICGFYQYLVILFLKIIVYIIVMKFQSKCIVIKYIFCFCFIFQNYGVMEGDLFYIFFVCWKFFWKYFYVRFYFIFDVYKFVVVSLDQQLFCGYMVYIFCGKLCIREGFVCLCWGGLFFEFSQYRRFSFQEKYNILCFIVSILDVKKERNRKQKYKYLCF